MRYIDLEMVRARLPAGWEEEAERAYQEIKDLDPIERARAINGRSHVWKALKEALEEASHKKCWYCESKEKRSDNPIDHFRPKNKVAECENHDGYWWLAFKWTNYRFSCTYCNSRRCDQRGGTTGGKHDHFPLIDEATRARQPEDEIEREEVELLDPTNASDPGLLWFNDEGQAVPKYNDNPYPRLHRRAKTSIELYHLNHVDTVEYRRELGRRIRKLIEDSNRFFADYAGGDQNAIRGYERAIEELRGMIKEEAEFSATARSLLMGLRTESGVVDAILATN